MPLSVINALSLKTFKSLLSSRKGITDHKTCNRFSLQCGFPNSEEPDSIIFESILSLFTYVAIVH